ncbi:two-component regulator propeller domain-containing protein [Parabacteroides faecis]|uniref:two-component regulator propeller domain-containing protein n=1 Tax=Parabacteroides faecis TaxID=1217282 RepID=UPI002165D23F|nr:two-component regulator propeller domain-containing protein [Parabacteroides faecis]MCS2891810.1 response regulator [Parabacteroides faecis]
MFFTCIGNGRGANPSYYFQQLGLDKGLSQTTVHCILADNKGLIWIGTASGLNCFDRYDMKSYYHEKDNPHSLPGNTIYFIAEDAENNIWISTNNGLTLYDKSSDSFRPAKFEDKAIISYSFCSLSGSILFTANEGIYIYDYKKQTFRKRPVLLEDSSNFSPYYIKTWDKDELLLVSQYKGVLKYNPITDQLSPTDYPVQTGLNAIYLDSKKRLYLSSYNKGFVCYAPDGKKLYTIHAGNSRLTSNLVLDFMEINNKLWVTTDGGGINIMDMDDPSDMTAIMHTPGDMSTIPVNSIKCIYKDKQENIWVGTVRGGMIGIKEVFMKTYKDVPLNNTNGLSDISVSSIHEDKKGRLWLGTDGGGINQYNPYTDTFKHYPATYGDKVVSITDYSDSELLVSLYTKGLYLFNKETGRYSRPFYVIDEATTIDQFHGGNASMAYRITDEWSYFLGKNAISHNLRTGKYSFLKIDGNKLAVGPMKMVCTDDRSAYIIQSNKLYEAHHGNDTLYTLLSIGTHEAIKAVARDKNGIFWIGTEYGFGYFDSKTKVFTKIETKLFNSVSTLLLDDQDRLWIGARNMLFSYDLKKKRFASWGESDGYTTNEFIYKYQVSSISDYIYLGGASGLLRINKNISTKEAPLPEVRLMDVLLNGNSCIDQLEASSKNRITIPHTHSSIEIKVISMEKDVFRNKLYRYMINGADKQYTETYNHILSLRMLAPGDYSILVSCNSKSGEWSEPAEVLHITVTPPWYQRPYVFAIFIILLTLMLFWTDRVSRRRRNRKMQWQMKEHTNRMNEEKVHFLINISHELRTPLTLIYAPLKRILDKKGWNDPEMMKGQLAGIYKQVLDMRNTINMVLDMNSLKETKTALHKTPYQLNEWIVSVAKDFESELEARNIRIKYQLDENIRQVTFDGAKCTTVLSNLLMNALKFSPTDTTITVSSQLEDGKVRISVADQGIGLGNLDANKLFTRYYQGNHEQSGSGIGLSFAKILIEKHNGTIGAMNNDDGGATFFFELPLGDDRGEQLDEENRQDTWFAVDTPSEPDMFSTNNYSIIIVEDKKELSSFLKEALLDSFKNIYVAGDGEEALEIINQKHPDIIVSDIMMPKMNGYELCKKIKEDMATSHIPVILLTARGDLDSTTMGYKLGADAYLAKPFDMELLLAVIVNQLKNREAIKQKYKESHLHLAEAIPAQTNNLDEEFMLKLNKLIHDNISSRELDVKFLTTQMGMSRTPLYAKLKALTNMGVNDYINMIRIEKASLLLLHSTMNITEISEAVGFEYPPSFQHDVQTDQRNAPIAIQK